MTQCRTTHRVIQSVSIKEWEMGHHLVQAVYDNTVKQINKVKLGEHGRDDRRSIPLQSPLC